MCHMFLLFICFCVLSVSLANVTWPLFQMSASTTRDVQIKQVPRLTNLALKGSLRVASLTGQISIINQIMDFFGSTIVDTSLELALKMRR